MSKKSHHYIPQCYLKGFCNTDERVWTYKKEDPQNPFLNKIDSTAVETYFYRLEAKGSSDGIEDFFGEQIEGPCSKILEKLRNKEFPIKQDRDKLSVFFSTLFVRTPLYIEHLTVSHNKELALFANLLASNKEKFHDEYKEMDPDAVENDIEEERQLILNGEVTYHKDIILSLMLRVGAIYSQHLSQRKWVLFETDNDNPFITSDNPLYLFHPNLQPLGFYQPGLGMKDTRIAIPISKDLMLLMLDDENVADEYVFSSTDLYNQRFYNWSLQAKMLEEIHIRQILLH